MATWVSLTDTPGAITANQFVVGNPGATALQFTPNLVRSGDSPPATLNFGTVGRAVVQMNEPDSTGRGSMRAFPDGLTVTTVPAVSATYVLQWDSTYVSNIPGGGGIGNDGMPNAVGWIGTLDLVDQGNLFNTGLLFNMGATVSCQAASGPIYTIIDQPTFRGDGGAFTVSQHNAARNQPRWGPNINGGSITQTTAVYTLNVATVDPGGVGTAAVTSLDYWSAGGVTLGAGGSIGTLDCIEIANITGPTTIRGINSAMASGTFINHTGVAVSAFAGDIHMNNGVALVLGSVGANRVELLRSAAGTMRMIGVGGTNNEALEWDFDPATADTIDVQSSTGAGLGFNLPAVAFGTSAADPTANNQFLEGFGAKTITLGGDFARHLFSASANVTVDAALSNLFTYTINEPAATIGVGSVVDAGNVLIQTSVSVGTNRYGLYITSNPTGGTLNYGLRVARDVRFDQTIEHTGSMGGWFGATPVVQQSIVGSRGGNVALANLLTGLANLGFIVDNTVV